MKKNYLTGGISFKSRARKWYPIALILFNIILAVPANAIGQEKELRDTEYGKVEANFC